MISAEMSQRGRFTHRRFDNCGGFPRLQTSAERPMEECGFKRQKFCDSALRR
jgi:hypothetical protein